MGIPYAEVIGDPVGHSKSPLIHGFWLNKLGVEGDYRATRIGPGALADFLAQRRRDPLWRGCNVTMPLKREAMSHVQPLQAQLLALGSVNTIVARNGALFGANTDTDGMLETLIAAGSAGPQVAMVGAGGAARAVCATLATYVPELLVINRDVAKAKAMVDELGVTADVQGLDTPLPPAGLLVNASAMGMRGFPPLPLSLDPLPADATVIDIVYDPLETPLLTEARARKLHVMDGLHMLIGQAAAAFALLFERLPPRQHDAELRELLTS